MSLSGLNLIVNSTDPSKQGLLSDFSGLVYAPPGATFREDTVPVALRVVSTSASPSRFWDDVDITSAFVQLAIDDPDLPPEQGFFTLTFGANTTPNLAYNVSAADMATQLNLLASIIAAGAVTVVQDGLDYVVTFTLNGARVLIQYTDVSLYPASILAVVRDQTGSADVPEIQTVSVFQAPAAYLTDWTPFPDAAATVISTHTGNSGSMPKVPSSQQITLNPAPYDGSFTITTSVGTTPALPWNVTSSAMAAALNAMSGATTNQYSVTGNPTGPYTITDAGGINTAITVNVSGLIVPVGLNGNLVLNSPAMRARFIGVTANAINLLLEVKVSFSGGGPSTILQVNVTVNKNVIRVVTGGYSPANPSAFLEFVNNEYSITGFTGGGANNLDGIATTSRVAGELHTAIVGGNSFTWELIAGAWPGGTSPFVIQPVDYDAGTNAKYWKLVTPYLDTDNTLAANSDARVASQKAVKAYVTANAGGAPSDTVRVANGNLITKAVTQWDTSGGALTAQTPATPAVGDWFGAEDAKLTWGTNNLTIHYNGTDKINGGTADYVASVTGNKLRGSYVSAGYGWSIK